jgi:hypothetical protein
MCQKKYNIAHEVTPRTQKTATRTISAVKSEPWMHMDIKATVKLSTDHRSDTRGSERKHAVTVES